MRRRTGALAWASGVTLALVLIFSVFATERAPAIAEPPLRPLPPGLAGATFADVLGAAAR